MIEASDPSPAPDTTVQECAGPVTLPRPDFHPAPAPPSAQQRIHDMPASERPREKLARLGAAALSDAELLAIFLRTGIAGLNAVDMGRALLQRFGNKWHQLSRLSVHELCTLKNFKGIGEAKAIHLVATFELARRLAREEYSEQVFDKPESVIQLLAAEMRAEPQEVLKVLLLDTRLKLLGVEEITRGTINETVAHPRDVLHHVIRRRAHGFIVVHNHPAGDPSPSAADRSFTRRLRESAETMQVLLADHVIIGLPSSAGPGYFSFREHGML